MRHREGPEAAVTVYPQRAPALCMSHPRRGGVSGTSRFEAACDSCVWEAPPPFVLFRQVSDTDRVRALDQSATVLRVFHHSSGATCERTVLALEPDRPEDAEKASARFPSLGLELQLQALG